MTLNSTTMTAGGKRLANLVRSEEAGVDRAGSKTILVVRTGREGGGEKEGKCCSVDQVKTGGNAPADAQEW